MLRYRVRSSIGSAWLGDYATPDRLRAMGSADGAGRRSGSASLSIASGRSTAPDTSIVPPKSGSGPGTFEPVEPIESILSTLSAAAGDGRRRAGCPPSDGPLASFEGRTSCYHESSWLCRRKSSLTAQPETFIGLIEEARRVEQTQN